MSNGRYRPYPEYDLCDADAPKVKPKHWRGMQVKHALRSTSSSGSAIKGSVSSEEAEGLFPAFSASGQDVWTPNWTFNERGIVLSAVGARCGKCFKADGHWSVVANTHVFLMNDDMDRDFFWYLVNDEDFWQKGGSAQPYVQVPASLSQRIGTPPLPEQTQIAAFLDHETAKIDRLIEKQEELIRLLKEKRQAVISHAVTKGLNPHAPLKDSGIEWLGQVPEHWEVCKLKHVISQLESGVSVNAADIPAEPHEIGVLKTSCVYTRSFRVEENKTVITEEKSRVRCPIRKGAIIISRMNTPELVGASALVNVNHSNIYLPDRLWQTVFRENISINPLYLAHYMTIKGFRNQISLTAAGASSSMQNITKEDYLNISLLLPPLAEQNAIQYHLEERVGSINTLIKHGQETITLLQERRTALISAAVTGKIDVRHWQPPVDSSELETPAAVTT